jgi:hypothetical protein
VILEGFNLLSPGVCPDGLPARTFVSGYVDF